MNEGPCSDTLLETLRVQCSMMITQHIERVGEETLTTGTVKLMFSSAHASVRQQTRNSSRRLLLSHRPVFFFFAICLQHLRKQLFCFATTSVLNMVCRTSFTHEPTLTSQMLHNLRRSSNAVEKQRPKNRFLGSLNPAEVRVLNISRYHQTPTDRDSATALSTSSHGCALYLPSQVTEHELSCTEACHVSVE